MSVESTSRPLADQQRRRAFWATGALVLGATVAIGALGDRQVRAGAARARPTASAGMRIVNAQAPAPATTTAPARQGRNAPRPAALGQADKNAIRAEARTFLSAYLAYEVGSLDQRTRGTLRRSATPAIARRLLAHPVKLPPGAQLRHGSVRSLQIESSADARPVRVRATIDHAGWVSGLTLQMTSAGGAWLVSAVT
jgi:hypothetical protein